MTKIVNYGLGNICAFLNVLKRLNVPVADATKPADLEGATRLILPGVGSFDHAMDLLERSGMRPVLENLVLERKVPILGVCVGMQIMAQKSEEGVRPGLGWFDASVRKLGYKAGGAKLRLPHMGWNDVEAVMDSTLLGAPGSNHRFYFLHSYYFDCIDQEAILAKASYGKGFAAAVRNQNIFGVQFHPEKSHDHGIEMLKRFSNI